VPVALPATRRALLLAKASIRHRGEQAGVWRQDTQSLFAEASSLRDDAVRGVRGLPGVARAANVTYVTMQMRGADTAVHALEDVNLSVAPGEVAGLIGPSGSGQSTLLKWLGAVIELGAGRMLPGGQTIDDNGWRSRDLRALRRDSIGFVFQAAYRIPFLDVTNSVVLLPMPAGRANALARARALELLQALDLGQRSGAGVVGRRAAAVVDRPGTDQAAAGQVHRL
jgi:ABC-type multidrug transport system fused ATPase/permease subunit